MIVFCWQTAIKCRSLPSNQQAEPAACSNANMRYLCPSVYQMLLLEKCFPWKDHSVSSVEHTDNWKWLNKNGRDISELAKKKQCRFVSKLVLWLHNFVSYEWPEKKEQLACTLVIPPFTAFNTSRLFCLSFVDGYSRQYSHYLCWPVLSYSPLCPCRSCIPTCWEFLLSRVCFYPPVILCI